MSTKLGRLNRKMDLCIEDNKYLHRYLSLIQFNWDVLYQIDSELTIDSDLPEDITIHIENKPVMNYIQKCTYHLSFESIYMKRINGQNLMQKVNHF